MTEIKEVTESLVWDGSVTIKDVIEQEIKTGRGIKITHDEGYFTFHFLEKDGKVFIYEQVFDFVGDRFYNKTICEVKNGKKAVYKMLKEICGDY